MCGASLLRAAETEDPEGCRLTASKSVLENGEHEISKPEISQHDFRKVKIGSQLSAVR